MSLRAPVPKTKSSKDFSDLSKTLNIIPYYGTTEASSDGTLRLLYDLYNYSPTQGSVINDILTFAFDGDIELQQKTIKGIKTPQQTTEVSLADIEAWVASLNALGLDVTDIITASKELGRDFKVSGNAYLFVRIATVNGIRKVSCKAIIPTNCYIQQSTSLDDEWFIISEEFTAKYFGKFPPKKVRKFPQFSSPEGQKNVVETIFHIKTKTDASDFYGRPTSLNSLMWQWVDYCAADKTLRIAVQDFTAAYILAEESQGLAVTDEDKKNLAANKAERIRDLATMRVGGEGNTLIYMEYAKGNTKPELIKFDLNRDVAYEEHIITTAKGRICDSHGYPMALLGSSNKGSSIGTNATVVYDYAIANSKIIKPLQETLQQLWSSVFEAIAADTILTTFQVKFPSKLTDLITEISNLKTPQIPTINDTTTTV